MNTELVPLEKSLQYYEKQVQAAQEVFDRAQDSLDMAQRNLALARSFYDLEKRRLHPDAGPSARFAAMTLREACATIVIESGRATTAHIVKELREGGQELRTPFPGRAIHAALMRARGVRKVSSGVYEATNNPPS